jgi:enamine deaminase RidA (YjgF/YER057c/UK114 family)
MDQRRPAHAPEHAEVVDLRHLPAPVASQQAEETGSRCQTEQVFTNLSGALSAVGANFGHVVKLTIFVTDLTPETLSVFREVRDRHIDAAHGPASSLVEVNKLFRPELLVEIEAIAVLPDGLPGFEVVIAQTPRSSASFLSRQWPGVACAPHDPTPTQGMLQG